MKTLFVVLLFAVVAVAYATSVPVPAEESGSDAASLDPTATDEGQTPVEAANAGEKDGDEASTSLRRNKRFFFTKFLFAPVAVAPVAVAPVAVAPVVSYSVPSAVTWTKTYHTAVLV